jgi:hypothetical protein
VVEKAKQTRTCRGEIAASVLEMMEGVYDAGLIDRQTMREFDEPCLSPALPVAPVKANREQEMCFSAGVRALSECGVGLGAWCETSGWSGTAFAGGRAEERASAIVE